MIALSVTDIAQTLPLLSGMTDNEKSGMLKEGQVRNYARGEHLFLHGDPAKHMYVLCKGTVRLIRETPDGNEFTTDVMIAGQTVGDTELFSPHGEYPYNAIAVDDVTALRFDTAWLKAYAQRTPPFAINLLAELSRRNQLASREAEQHANMTAVQRIVCFMQHLCTLHDFNPHGFELPYNKTLIASRLGIEPETFSRALAKISDYGITVKGTTVTMTNLDAIENKVCTSCSIAGNCPEHKMLEQKMNALAKPKGGAK